MICLSNLSTLDGWQNLDFHSDCPQGMCSFHLTCMLPNFHRASDTDIGPIDAADHLGTLALWPTLKERIIL